MPSTAHYVELEYPEDAQPTYLDPGYAAWIHRQRTKPSSMPRYIVRHKQYDVLLRHRELLPIKPAEQQSKAAQYSLEAEAKRSSGYGNRFVLDSHVDEGDMAYGGYAAMVDRTFLDEASAAGFADRTVAEVVEFADNPAMFKIVTDNLRHCRRQHLDAVYEYRTMLLYCVTDPPLRSHILKTHARAIASYGQILELIEDGVASLLAAHTDGALLLQGRRLDMAVFKGIFGWDANSFEVGIA